MAEQNGTAVSAKQGRFFRALTAGAMIALMASPAWAVYPQRVTLTGEGASEIPSTSISFNLPDGTAVPVQEDDDDDSGLILLFPGDMAEPGTLVVNLPGQPPRRIAVPRVPAGSDLVVDLPRGVAMVVPGGSGDRPGKPGSPRVRLGLLGGYGESFVPPVGAGTLIFGNGEDFAAQTDDKVSGPAGGGTASFPLFGGQGHFAVVYGEGSDGATNSTPAGGNIDTGIVFTDFAPSGSTGLFLGNAGLDTRIARDVESFSIGGGYRHPLDREGVFGAGVSLFYSTTQTDIAASVSSPTFGNDITADYTQSLDDNRFTLFLTLDYDGSQAVEKGFFVTAGGGVGVDFYDVSLESRQSVVCNLCGGADQAFTLEVGDERDGTAFAARGFAGAGFKFGGNVAVSFNGFVEHRDKVAQIVNPRTGDDLFLRNQPTTIGFDSGTSYGGFVLVTIGLE